MYQDTDWMVLLYGRTILPNDEKTRTFCRITILWRYHPCPVVLMAVFAINGPDYVVPDRLMLILGGQPSLHINEPVDSNYLVEQGALLQERIGLSQISPDALSCPRPPTATGFATSKIKKFCRQKGGKSEEDAWWVQIGKDQASHLCHNVRRDYVSPQHLAWERAHLNQCRNMCVYRASLYCPHEPKMQIHRLRPRNAVFQVFISSVDHLCAHYSIPKPGNTVYEISWLLQVLHNDTEPKQYLSTTPLWRSNTGVGYQFPTRDTYHSNSEKFWEHPITIHESHGNLGLLPAYCWETA